MSLKSLISGNGRWLVASAVVAGLVATPFAFGAGEGNPVKGGKRNPSSNASVAYTSETQIIANNGTYGTRQSNKGDGGGAIYGCRSAPGAEPCLRGSNLEKGRAFEFSTGGAEGGLITAVGGDAAKPFTTNATGVATGLNADRVDSKSADEISKDAVTTVQNGLRFAAVGSDGTLGTKRGVDSSSRTGEGRYTVLFSADVSTCAFSATETDSVNAGAVGVSLGADKKTLTVVTRAGGGADGTGATLPSDRPFHLTANCV
jgi:hypothetical protein